MYFRLTAATVEQAMSALQGNRSSLFPVATAVGGDGHGKLPGTPQHEIRD